MRKEKKTAKKRIVFSFMFYLTIVYLGWRLMFTLPFGRGWVSMTTATALMIVEVLGLFESMIHFENIINKKNYKLPQISENEYPDVDVFIATYNEEAELLYKTVNGCRNMKYPDPSKVHIYLCDDNRRPEIRQLAAEMGVGYFDRPDNKGAKAGNLNNAMAQTTSPYIVTFDADMIPHSDFLLRTIPYFVEAEKVNAQLPKEERIPLGMLQTPQAFYNPDLFQFNLFSEDRIPNEQDYFYRDIQVARTSTNSVIYGGSNTILSREALNHIGGFYTEAITEDFATGLLMEKAGFVSMAIPDQLAIGLSPSDLKSLIQQRVRWGRGVIDTGRSMHLFSGKGMTLGQRLNYLASVWYWYSPVKRLIYILSPIVFATFGFMVLNCTLPELLIFWLPMYMMMNYSMKMLSQNIRSAKWTMVYETIFFPFLLIPIILETFGLSMKQFKVTEKTELRSRRGENLIYTIPFIILIVLSVIGIIKSIVVIFDSNSIAPIVSLFWLINNLFGLVMALFFMDGRDSRRQCERFPRNAKAYVETESETFAVQTVDVSETGVAIVSDLPIYLNPENLHRFTVETEKGSATMIGRLIYAASAGKQWKYVFEISEFLNSYDEWLYLLYNNEPDLPQAIKKDSGVLEDLKLNMIERFRNIHFENRFYPEVECKLNVMTGKNGQEVNQKSELVGFNYQTMILKGLHNSDFITVAVPSENGTIWLEGTLDGRHREGTVYKVSNLEQFVANNADYLNLMNALMNAQGKPGNLKFTGVYEEQKPKKANTGFSEVTLVP